MPVAEIFLTAFISVLFEKLASGELIRFARQDGIYTQLKKWQSILSNIQAVLSDAEEKQITNNAISNWLENLGDLAYDLDDLLDKFSTIASVRNLKVARTSDQPSTSKVMKFFPTCCTHFNPYTTVMFDRKMRSEIDEISTRLDDILNLKNSLDLRENVRGMSNRLTKRLPTTSLVDESRVFGRESDKRVIIEWLLKDHDEAIPEVFSVIPIVGMGGVGKTTLAQLVYNDDEVTDCFDLKVWACVPEEFDVFMITKMIFESVTTESYEFDNLNMLQVSLKEKLFKQRFLLVLDDVWNENYEKWDLLCGPLRAGAPGCKIIVTTRHERVASTMGSVQAYPLNVLGIDDCLSILAQHAIGRRDFDAHPSLKVIGEAIVRYCKGLPLAAKILGGLLRTDLSLEYWEEIMNSKIWNIENCGILPALRLSYNHLPSHLKQLFAYCSIFPNDYEFDRNELVLLWMAEGFLKQSEGEKPMEELGCEYFNDLLSRSFFQCSSGSESRFVMHDLMNDLAQVIAGKISFRLDSETRSTEVSENTRHLSFVRQKYEAFKKFKAFHGVKGLRTFLPLPIKSDFPNSYLSNRVLTDLLPKLQCLRVLSLSGYSISEIPESIGDLKQLRYLNLSDTLIRWLPESVTELYNLQTLLLRGCRKLTKLPISIGSLINLRHLDCIGTDQLREMPAGIGKLVSLRTLPKIVLGGFNGLQVKELRSLSDIRGTLTIVGLHTVRNIQVAMEAKLFSKHRLDEVVMEWTHSFDDSRNKSLEKEVLDVLQPHRNLKKLEIISYGGTKFPKWVGDTSFSSIVHLELRNCREFASLPSLGQLPLLRNLRICGIDRVKSVGVEFYGAGCPPTVAFPSLQTLTFEDMPNWEEWSTLIGVEVFPCLCELRIWRCPSLIKVSLSRLPALRVLNLEKCPEVVLRCMVGIASLTTLTVQGISGLTGLQKETLQFLGALENLKIMKCHEMTSLWQEEGGWKSLIHLRKLEVWFCFQLLSLAGESGALPQNLEILSLFNCPNLEKLPNGVNNLTSLQEFLISDCPRIVYFRDTWFPPMLTMLEITRCEGLDVQTCNYEETVMQSNCKVINAENDGDENNNHEHTENFSHLERMRIEYCSSLSSFPTGYLPSTLKELCFRKCTKLQLDLEKSLHNCISSLELLVIDGWLNFKTFPECLFRFLHLTYLYIEECPGLESFPELGLPRNLRVLDIRDCVNLKLLPDQMQSLTALEDLQIRGCPSLSSFPQGGFPTNLKKLFLGDLRVRISEWGLQTFASLDFLRISGECPELVCFPGDCRLPTSLRCLDINGAVNLESLSVGLQDLPSLEELSILKCPKLRSLPNMLLSNLSCLNIGSCPLLKQQCFQERGEYWPWIAPIPSVFIDYRNIHRL